jgi:hypothetical protein
MNKVKTIEGIKRARQVHEIQMKKIKTLVSGVWINNPTPEKQTECGFGKWLYDENNHIRDLLGELFYNNIETLHGRWHTEYARMYDMFYKKKKSGFFTNLFSTTQATDMELDKAKLYCSELETTTNELLKAIDISQKRLNALPESKFY